MACYERERNKNSKNWGREPPCTWGLKVRRYFAGSNIVKKMTIVILIHPSGLIYGVWMNNFGLKTCLRQKLFIYTPYKRLEWCIRKTIVIYGRNLTPWNTASPSDPMYRGVPNLKFCYFYIFTVHNMSLHDLKHCRQKFIAILILYPHPTMTINHGQPRKTNGQPYLIMSIKIKSQLVW